jgi:hypothetical protein
MVPVLDELQILLLRDLDAFAREIQAFPDDNALWRTAPGVANAAGNLALHVAGNLRHFVGGLLGGIPYQRNRELEFSRKQGTRQEVVEELQAARQAVVTALSGLTEQGLRAEFPAEMEGRRLSTEALLVRLSVHLAYHLGQADYLRRLG